MIDIVAEFPKTKKNNYEEIFDLANLINKLKIKKILDHIYYTDEVIKDAKDLEFSFNYGHIPAGSDGLDLCPWCLSLDNQQHSISFTHSNDCQFDELLKSSEISVENLKNYKLY